MKREKTVFKISYFCKALICLRALIICFFENFKYLLPFTEKNDTEVSFWLILSIPIMITSFFITLLISGGIIYALEIDFAIIGIILIPLEIMILLSFIWFLLIPLIALGSEYQLLIISDNDLENLGKKYFEMFKLRRKLLKLDFQLNSCKKLDRFLLIKYDEKIGLGIFFEKDLMSTIPYEVFQSTLKTELEQLVEQESKRLSEIEKAQQLAQEEMLLAQRQAEKCRDSYPISH